MTTNPKDTGGGGLHYWMARAEQLERERDEALALYRNAEDAGDEIRRELAALYRKFERERAKR